MHLPSTTFVITLLCLIASGTLAQAPVREQEGTLEQLRTAQKIVSSKRVLSHVLPEVKIKDIPCGDVVDYLRDAGVANIFVNRRATDAANIDPNAAITVVAKSVTIAKVLESVSQQINGLEIDHDDEIIYISTASDLKEIRAFKERVVHGLDKQAGDILRTRMLVQHVNRAGWARENLVLTELSLEECIRELSNQSGVEIKAHWNDFRSMGFDGQSFAYIRLRNATLLDALTVMLASTRHLNDISIEVQNHSVRIIPRAPKLTAPAPTSRPAAK